MGTKVTLAVSDGTNMAAFVARPQHPGPGLILLQEAFGVNAHIRDLAERFAAEGYLVLAPELFHRTAPGGEFGYEDFNKVRPHYEAITVEGLEADLRACWQWLKGEGCAKIGAVGFCLGGRSTYIANSALPLSAAVSFYGGGISGALLNRAREQNGPIVFFWGGKDKNIPIESRRALNDALRTAGKDFTDIEFAAADHAFFRDVGAKYDAAAAAQAWALTKAFFKEKLA